jgi:predicted nucleic acid-binding protein
MEHLKILLDSSVIVAGLVEAHPMHRQALPWLVKAKAGEFSLLLCTHSLAEVLAVLTSLPIRPPIKPEVALRLIEENLESIAQTVELGLSDYRSVLRSAAENRIGGGAIYDALIVRAAECSGADKLLTFNIADFQRIWPSGAGVISSP